MKQNRIVSATALALALMLPLGAAASTGAQEKAQGNILTAALPGIIIVILVLGLTIGRKLFAASGSSTMAQSEPGRVRNYGMAGGAVCRACGRPFARSAFDPNLVAGKLTRCPHCGKWAILPAASPMALLQAEERERMMAGGAPPAGAEASQPLTEEEKLRRQIERSRFE